MKTNVSSINEGFLFGSYITTESGGQNMLGCLHVASFKLKVAANLSPSIVVYIDAAYNGGAVLNSIQVRADNFAFSNV